MPKINGIAWDEDSKYYKELNRWNLSKRDGGMNRDGFEKYPQMLYMAQRHPLSNTWVVAVKEDVVSLDGKTVLLHADSFNRSCQETVNDDREYDMKYKAGWRPSQGEALEYREAHDQMVAEAAAFRAHEDRKMSEKAQAEVAKVEKSTSEHIAEVPVQPVRRGRKPGSKNKPKPEAQV